jgi:PIN domain nuclease of toxin-antitoxin system
MGRRLERHLNIAYLDTQAAAWAYGEWRRLSKEAKRLIDRNRLLLSPMAFLELQYLFDKRAISANAETIYEYLHSKLGVTLCDFPFPLIAREALTCGWTTDPFDRIIVSHAKANNNAILITADMRIAEHYARARW